MRIDPRALLLASACLLVSCEKDSHHGSSNNGAGTQNEATRSDSFQVNGIYVANLQPVNSNLHIQKVGTAALKRNGDTFTAMVRIKYGQRGTTLRQGVYTGTRCPNLKDDRNKDAFIDIKEAKLIIGDLLIPLDENLDSQLLGAEGYPTGEVAMGAYTYEVVASFERMLADLKAPDDNANDSMVKLPADSGLSLEGKVVILQGLNKKIYLPNTVGTTPGGSNYQTLPVACGVLKKEKVLPPELMVAN